MHQGELSHPFRFQFRLRTLLLLVVAIAAIAAVFLEPARITARRKEVRRDNPDFLFFDHGVNYDARVSPDWDVPILRRLFGDTGTVDIALPITTSERDRR